MSGVIQHSWDKKEDLKLQIEQFGVKKVFGGIDVPGSYNWKLHKKALNKFIDWLYGLDLKQFFHVYHTRYVISDKKVSYGCIIDWNTYKKHRQIYDHIIEERANQFQNIVDYGVPEPPKYKKYVQPEPYLVEYLSNPKFWIDIDAFQWHKMDGCSDQVAVFFAEKDPDTLTSEQLEALSTFNPRLYRPNSLPQGLDLTWYGIDHLALHMSEREAKHYLKIVIDLFKKYEIEDLNEPPKVQAILEDLYPKISKGEAWKCFKKVFKRVYERKKE